MLQFGSLLRDPPAQAGQTVACLTDKKDKLSTGCKLQIIRVAELQADDWSKDRRLFHACRSDRERLCRTVVAGNGQVYSCLYKNKFNQAMSEKVWIYCRVYCPIL